ncbi:hypothetical protein GCM10009760_26870 [Kitasatospora kazusensis]|uniref:Nudix hydrolase domain-containing protein n=1 Tax=Kitasatospora kazusensis TaxID=407974 RepID=A0ABP5L5J9_9ACTN
MTKEQTHFESPPRRRVAGQAVLIHPDDERVLLLDRADHPRHRLPGGHAAPDEPAHRTVRRLVRAQLGVTLPFTGADLAAVDYSPANRSTGGHEGYTFVFALRLTTARAATARPGPGLLGFDWTAPEHLSTVCDDHHVRRISEALAWYAVQGSAALLVNGALAA